jgi:ribosome-associated protein
MATIDDDAPVDDGEDEGVGRESHREKTVRMRAVAALARALVGMNTAQLATIPLEPDLREAVVACQGFRKNALARQLRRIGSLLRCVELEPIERAVAEVQSGRGERSRREQSYEHARTRLLQGGDAAMTAFVAAHPGADVQALRQHVRTALRDPESDRGKRASRELLRAIRALGDAAREAPPPDTAADEADDLS